jgi:hypothetical protein
VAGQVDEYLRQAEEARRLAEQSKTEKGRTGWLRLAQQWLSLIPGHLARSASKSTGDQDRSTP